VADLQQATIAGMTTDPAPLLHAAAAALSAARAAGMTVLHTRVAFRPGHPEVSPRNKLFSALLGTDFMVEGGAEVEFHPAVAPIPGEVVVTKHRAGAFSGTDLEQLLRARAIEHLVFVGVMTSAVILTTVRVAADLDFRITVLADAVADDDPEVNDVLLRSVFARLGDVIDTESFAASVRTATTSAGGTRPGTPSATVRGADET
jgi:nicotinamidase-related amidase